LLSYNDQVIENVDVLCGGLGFEQLFESVYLWRVFDSLRAILKSDFESYRFVVMAGKTSDSNDFSQLRKAKTVVLNISDETSSIPAALCANVLAVFKNYLPSEKLVPNLFSLPLGYAKSTPEMAPLAVCERPQNAFFSGNLNSRREPLFKAVAKPMTAMLPRLLFRLLKQEVCCDQIFPQSYIRFTTGFGKGLAGDIYAGHLRDSKFTLCPGGFESNETFRHFESMRAGAIVISEPLPPLRFYQGSPIVIIEDWRQLSGLLTNLLSCPESLAERQQKTLDWWSRHCSESATADYIASSLSALQG
jgi:hypothetical protein